MHLKGETLINSTAEPLWAVLADPVALARFIDGVDSVQRLESDRFSAVAAGEVAGEALRFPLDLRLSEQDPPHSLRISGEAVADTQGAPAGFVEFVLIPQGPDRTLVQHAITLAPGGASALLEGRALEAAIDRRAADFCRALKAHYEPQAPEATPSAAGIRAASLAAAVGEATSPARGLPAWAWVGGLVLLVLATTALLLA